MVDKKMVDKKIEAFKIGDTRKPTVPSPKRTQQAVSRAEAQSLGFRRIEGILEREEPAAVQQNLERLKEALHAHERELKASKDKAAVKKAIGAVGRTAELMDFLFKTKQSLIEAAGK
jgi:hypothetical protein